MPFSRLRNLQYSNARAVRSGYRVIRTMFRDPKAIALAVVDQRRRAQLLFSWFHGPSAHQIPNATATDRYPALFELVADGLSDRPDPRILSFGCSTGEEAATALKYVPNAKVVGVDINRWNIRMARKTFGGAGVGFHTSIEKIPQSARTFDAILCMAVLQSELNKPVTVTDSNFGNDAYPFERFEQQLFVLDRHLKPGGILIIEYANYLFEETALFERYVMIAGDNGRPNNHPLFNRENKRISDERSVYRAFRKTAAHSD